MQETSTSVHKGIRYDPDWDDEEYVKQFEPRVSQISSDVKEQIDIID